MCTEFPPPFYVNVLGEDNGSLSHLFPATYRTSIDGIVTPYPNHLQSFLENELFVSRLNAIQSYLWLCGRPMPPRPLHQQLVMSRNIVVTERMDMHLVWSNARIFIKPMPAYLLHPDFWATHLPERRSSPPRSYNDLAACARGFLFTYTALIAYRSDFTIAQQHGLLPPEVTWRSWQVFCSQLLSNHCYAAINPRFWYGELRLTRLNKIYALSQGWLFRGYSRVGGAATYEDLLRRNFAALATGLGYVVIVLTSIQAGLATDRLQGSDSFQNASYEFTVFSITAPLIGACLIMLPSLCIFVSNWVATNRYEARRFGEMGVDAPWRVTTPGRKDGCVMDEVYFS